MTELQLGIYRHYKGPLYLVLGLAHDANSQGLMYCSPGEPVMNTEQWWPEQRKVVVYTPLQLNGAHLGPRMAVRTLEDFLGDALVTEQQARAWVKMQGTATAVLRHGDTQQWEVARFTYLGPELTAEML